MNIFYSPSNNAFYDLRLKPIYEKSLQGWPQDCVEITNTELKYFKQSPPLGKHLTPLNGRPNWEQRENNPSPKQTRDLALANIRWVRPTDSVVIQIRHPDYASDVASMERKRDKLQNGESSSWIDINNNPISITKEDMNECLAYYDEQVDRIFSDYINTLGNDQS